MLRERQSVCVCVREGGGGGGGEERYVCVSIYYDVYVSIRYD